MAGEEANSERIKSVLLAEFNRLTPAPQAALQLDLEIEQIGLDSISLTQIVFAIEEALNLELSEAVIGELSEAHTIGNFYETLSRFADEQQAAFAQ